MCLLILRLRFKLAPENHFQATSRKPDTSIFWLMAVLRAEVVSGLRVVKVTGHRGLMACERLMGMIPVMLSV